MNKNWRNFLIFLVVVGIVGYLIIIPYDNSNYQNDTVISHNTDENAYLNDSFSNVQELHWTHMPLTYRIENESNCKDYELNNIKEAISIIGASTNETVRFLEINQGKTDITFICLDISLDKEIKCENVSFNYSKRDFSVYGEGILNSTYQLVTDLKLLSRNQNETEYEVCYTESEFAYMQNILGEAMPQTSGNQIMNVTIYLYRIDTSRCSNFPVREIHEILHVLGFAHTFSWENYIPYSMTSEQYAILQKDIMFPIINCIIQTELNKKYSSCMRYIYSNKQYGYCLDVSFLKSCDKGYILGGDNECYISCGEGYCPSDYSCCNGQCLKCQTEYYLGKDCMCYPY